MKLFKVLRGLAIACGVMAAATGAQAAGDEPDKFNGGYAGLVSGYGAGDANLTEFPSINHDLDLEGPLAGITAGINFRNGSLLYGLEADAQVLGLTDKTPCNGMGVQCHVDIDAMITGRARLGYIFGSTDQFAVFATGGFANLWVDFIADGPAGARPRDTSTELTYAVGGGVEGYVMDTNWISTKLEFLYVGDLGYSVSFLQPGASVDFNQISIDDLFFVRWGWAIHF